MKDFKVRFFLEVLMRKILEVLFSIMIISSFSSVYAQEPIVLEQISPSGKVLINLEWPEVYPGEIYTFKISFHDPETGNLLDEIRMNYNLYVTQHDHEVEHYKGIITTNGTEEFEVLFPEDSEGLAKVVIELIASTDHEITTVYKEVVTFSVNVVPEFGVIAMIILSIAFVPILLLSKSKLMSKF